MELICRFSYLDDRNLQWLDNWPDHGKQQQRHLIQAHIPSLSNCKDIGEEPSSLHNGKHTHATQHYAVTALHTLNNTVAKGYHQMPPPWANNHKVSTYQDIQPPRAPFQVMAYADDTTIISTQTNTSAAKKYIQPYLHKVFAWTKQNNLTLNPDKPSCTMFTPDPAEYNSNLDLKINNTALPMATHPKVLGLTVDRKLTYSTHIYNISVKTHKPLQMIKALTTTWWGKQMETLIDIPSY